jgi:hypothetical protein
LEKYLAKDAISSEIHQNGLETKRKLLQSAKSAKILQQKKAGGGYEYENYGFAGPRPSNSMVDLNQMLNSNSSKNFAS